MLVVFLEIRVGSTEGIRKGRVMDFDKRSDEPIVSGMVREPADVVAGDGVKPEGTRCGTRQMQKVMVAEGVAGARVGGRDGWGEGRK